MLLDQNLEYFHKGNFAPINHLFISDWLDALSKISMVQKKYEKKDMDTILNELHDAIAAKYLWFQLVNTNKHWLDCKYSDDIDIFLESKVATFSKDMTATFNDTTFEKADVFRDKKVWLALSIWNSASELMFICYWQNELIWDFLEEGVQKHKDGKVVRSTQSLSLTKLLFDYGFHILSITKTKEEIITLLTSLSPRGYQRLVKDQIYTLSNFPSILSYYDWF